MQTIELVTIIGHHTIVLPEIARGGGRGGWGTVASDTTGRGHGEVETRCRWGTAGPRGLVAHMA